MRRKVWSYFIYFIYFIYLYATHRVNIAVLICYPPFLMHQDLRLLHSAWQTDPLRKSSLKVALLLICHSLTAKWLALMFPLTKLFHVVKGVIEQTGVLNQIIFSNFIIQNVLKKYQIWVFWGLLTVIFICQWMGPYLLYPCQPVPVDWSDPSN